MTATLTKTVPLVLRAETAADLMRPDPVSLRGDATIQEALDLFTSKGFSAAPVIDDAGRPIGVLSHSDLVVHAHARGLAPGTTDPALVRDLMTPTVFAVSPETPAEQVVADLLALKVHRLFVVDGMGILTGVISALEVLRHLRRG
jgi:CBS domain-containing protein